jgi:hypothetical protein
MWKGQFVKQVVTPRTKPAQFQQKLLEPESSAFCSDRLGPDARVRRRRCAGDGGDMEKQTDTFYLEAARQIKTETTTQKFLLLYLASHTEKGGQFSVGLDQMVRETGLSERTICRTTADFKAAGILTWTRGYGNRFTGVDGGVTNAYEFNRRELQRLPFIPISQPQPRSKRSEALSEVGN